jgi:hypothetical protein
MSAHIGEKYSFSGVVTDIQDDGRTIEILIGEPLGYVYVSAKVLERMTPDA